MPADLTHDTSGPGAVTYGLTCMEHPSATRRGLTQAHATNAVAKHNRDHHGDDLQPDLVNVSAACGDAILHLDAEAFGEGTALEGAQALAMRSVAISFLEALTGLTGEAAIRQAETWAEAQPPIVAHVAPF